MKEYYFLSGKDQNGPFSLEELIEKCISIDSLVWTEGMENWERIKDLPELIQYFKAKSLPPPVPQNIEDNISNSVNSEHLNVSDKKLIDSNSFITKLPKNVLLWLIIWWTFHLFALLMSYSRIDFFNNEYPESNKFWPFVSYNRCAGTFDYSRGIDWDKYARENGDWMQHCFNGIFAYYDWTEFAFYVGGALVVLVLIQISNKKD